MAEDWGNGFLHALAEAKRAESLEISERYEVHGDFDTRPIDPRHFTGRWMIQDGHRLYLEVEQPYRVLFFTKTRRRWIHEKLIRLKTSIINQCGCR